jgi:hypothetical protein
MGIAADIFREIGDARVKFDAEFQSRVPGPKNTAWWVLFRKTWENYLAHIRKAEETDRTPEAPVINEASDKENGLPIGFGNELARRNSPGWKPAIGHGLPSDD